MKSRATPDLPLQPIAIKYPKERETSLCPLQTKP
jgi:hypothetical protein